MLDTLVGEAIFRRQKGDDESGVPSGGGRCWEGHVDFKTETQDKMVLSAGGPRQHCTRDSTSRLAIGRRRPRSALY